MITLSEYLETPPMGDIVAMRTEAENALREGRIQYVRRFKAAESNRLNSRWMAQPSTANYEIRQSLQALRARSREMCQNNALGKRYLSLVQSNVVGGSGMQLQCRARTANGKKLQEKLNKQVEDLFYEWTSAETCSASGKLDFIGVQNLAMRSLARDGEILIQLVKSNNKFGLSLKVINVDYLDEQYNGRHSNGNRIIMSVEVNNDNRPVAYWLRVPPSGRQFAPTQDSEPVRVPAEEIIHRFLITEDEEQTRGVPWFHAVLLTEKYLANLLDSVLIAAQLGANTLGFVTNPAPLDANTSYTGEDEDGCVKGNIEFDSSPGQFVELDPGQEVEKWDPDQPHQNHAEHAKMTQGTIATGLDVPYFELTGDLSEVNFSSARIGLSSSRDVWKALQGWLGRSVCDAIYHAFLKSAFINGLISISPRDYAELRRPMWRGRSWDYIEPMKDIQSDLMAIAGGIRSRTGVLADRGEDFVDFLETVKSERDKIEEMDLEFSADGKAITETPDPNANEDENGNQSTLDDIEVVNRRANAYGVGVRAGALTPQTDDEEDFRQALGLPGMSADAKRAWTEDKGVRRPITLVSSDGTHPAANAADTTDTANDDSDGEPKAKKKDKTAKV